MARGKAVTKGGRCLKCNGGVAWKLDSKLGGTGVSPWVLCNAAKDANGEYILKDGKFTPGTNRHSCWNRNETTAQVETKVETAQAETKAEASGLDASAIKGFVRAEIVNTLETFGIRQESRTIIEVKLAGKTIGTSGDDEPMHEALPELLRYMAAKEPVYLHGPAGSGKTHGAEQAARILGIESILTTMPGMTAGKLLGYQGLDGKDVITPFMRAFTEGCVFIADEFDRCIPSVAAALNSALANRFYTVGTRTVTAHENFVFVADGNTDMRGATRQFTAAQPLDLATAARFAFIYWGIDEKLEDATVYSILGPSSKALVSWRRKMAAVLARDMVETVICGPRESIKIAKALVAGHPIDRAVSQWIWRGYSPEAIARYYRECPLPTVAGK